jgi:hypothetical protein
MHASPKFSKFNPRNAKPHRLRNPNKTTLLVKDGEKLTSRRLIAIGTTMRMKNSTPSRRRTVASNSQAKSTDRMSMSCLIVVLLETTSAPRLPKGLEPEADQLLRKEVLPSVMERLHH